MNIDELGRQYRPILEGAELIQRRFVLQLKELEGVSERERCLLTADIASRVTLGTAAMVATTGVMIGYIVRIVAPSTMNAGILAPCSWR